MAPVVSSFYPFAYNYAIKLFIDAMVVDSPLLYKDIMFPIVLFVVTQFSLDFVWIIHNIAEWKSVPYVRRSILLQSYDYVQHHSYRFFQDNFTGTRTYCATTAAASLKPAMVDVWPASGLRRSNLYVVGIGASAGGLEALTATDQPEMRRGLEAHVAPVVAGDAVDGVAVDRAADSHSTTRDYGGQKRDLERRPSPSDPHGSLPVDMLTQPSTTYSTSIAGEGGGRNKTSAKLSRTDGRAWPYLGTAEPAERGPASTEIRQCRTTCSSGCRTTSASPS